MSTHSTSSESRVFKVRSIRRILPGLLALVASTAASLACAQQIGEVSTAFRFLGKNDRIVVEGFDDPKVKGVTCYVSRARTGGIKGSVGLAEDRSEASIACRQVGDKVTFIGQLPAQEDVFTERLSLVFKRLHVVRVVDPVRNALVYMTYSDRLIDGSPKNSVTAVAIPRTSPIPMK
jgi:CreA protein